MLLYLSKKYKLIDIDTLINMKKPPSPPAIDELLKKYSADIPTILGLKISTLYKNQYIHWDKLRLLPPIHNLSHEQWWLGIKLARINQYKALPLKDLSNRPFVYILPDSAFSMLHKIDTQGAGVIGSSAPVISEENRNRFIFNSLIEEAITSSQLEGASTTRQNAVDMIRNQRKPKDHSEKMIMNNYIAMEKIRALKDSPMTFDLLMEIHHTLTIETLDDPTASGRIQSPNEERVQVIDNRTAQVLHNPPPAKDLSKRLDSLFQFANRIEGEPFIHPVIHAIILHFWLAYEHPFVDGNGRTARALFYWAMLRQGYWMFEYISISRILKMSPAKYGKSYMESETDDNDLTYFIHYNLEVIRQALEDLELYLDRKAQQLNDAEKSLKQTNLNYREISLIAHALRHPNHEYSIKSHQTSHHIAYATARADLMHLASNGWLMQRRIGEKTLAFRAIEDLEKQLETQTNKL